MIKYESPKKYLKSYSFLSTSVKKLEKCYKYNIWDDQGILTVKDNAKAVNAENLGQR